VKATHRQNYQEKKAPRLGKQHPLQRVKFTKRRWGFYEGEKSFEKIRTSDLGLPQRGEKKNPRKESFVQGYWVDLPWDSTGTNGGKE